MIKDATSRPMGVGSPATGGISGTTPSKKVETPIPAKASNGGDLFTTPKQVEQARVREPVPVAASAIKGISEMQQIKPGDFTFLSGKVINKDPAKINNDGPPGGAYLQLDEPVLLVDEKTAQRYEVREVFISLDEVTQQACGTRGNNCGSCSISDSCMVGRKLPEDRSMTIHGQIGTFAFGGEGRGKAPGFVVGIGGASVLGKERKEPLYKADKQFHDFDTGQVLETLVIKNPDVPNPTVNKPQGYRHPDAQLVFAKEPVPSDPNRMVVWVGKSGGGSNVLGDFHGFSGFHVPRPPNAEELADIKFQDKGPGEKGLFTADSAPRIKKGNKYVELEPLGPALGQQWFLDRSGRKAYGVTMKKAPESGYELSSVIPFKTTDFIAGPAPEPPFGYFKNPDGSAPIDGRQAGHETPRDIIAQTKREQPVYIARRVDPDKVDGPGGWFTTHIGPDAKHPEKPIYGPLMEKAGADGLVSPGDFKKSLREVVEATPGGKEIVAKIREVMAKAEEEYQAGRAAEPPADKEAWFDFLLDSYLHSHDLRIWLKALGFGSTSVEGHDLVEMVPLKDVEWQMQGRYVEPWFKNYVEEEKRKGLAAGLREDEIMVNCSFLNPNYAAAGYLWGFSALSANWIMNLHRLSCHHAGNTHEEIFWIEKALNFMIHHVPLEDFGVRHEEAGMFSKLVKEGVIQKSDLDPENLSPEKMFDLLEKSLHYAMEHDPAMSTSEIGKAIIRDAWKVWKELAQRGYVQPWQMARPRQPNDAYPLTPKLEGSYRQLQVQTRAGKHMFDAASKALAAAVGQASPDVRAQAERLSLSLVQLRDSMSTSRADTKVECEAIVAAHMAQFRQLRGFATGSEGDRKVLDAAAKMVLSSFAMYSVFNEAAAEAFTAPTAELEQSLIEQLPVNAPNAFLSKEDLLRAIAEMREVPRKAELARKDGDEVLAGKIMDIYHYWTNGFLSVNPADEKLAQQAI